MSLIQLVTAWVVERALGRLPAWCQKRDTKFWSPSAWATCIISDAQKSVPPYMPGDLFIARVCAKVWLDASYSPASATTWALNVSNGVPGSEIEPILNGAPGTPAASIERKRIHTANPVTTGSWSGAWNFSWRSQNQKLRPNS